MGVRHRRSAKTAILGNGSALFPRAGQAITNVRIAPSQTLVGFIEQAPPDDSGESRGDLVVLDRSGQELYRRAAVQQFTWNAETSEVLQITGTPTEEGIGDRPQALLISDPSTGATSRVDLPGTAYRVEWATFDSAAYVETLTCSGHPSSGTVKFGVRSATMSESHADRGRIRLCAVPCDPRSGAHTTPRRPGDTPLTVVRLHEAQDPVPDPGPQHAGCEGSSSD